MGQHKHNVVCFGEVLWDILPSGEVPGGAPMNVAYHLHKLNKQPALITRIGMDKRGHDLMNIFSGRGVCTDYFQVDNTYGTGSVFVKADDASEVAYDIVKPAAWDFIELEAAHADLLADAGYFVFGSLAARGTESRNTLFALLEMAKYKVLDINLRAPHYSRGLVEELLRKADFVKMNRAELELITGWVSNFTSLEDRMKSIRDRFNIPNIVVTMGGDGALLYRDELFTGHKGYPVEVVDTIGSGDAFLAGFLSRLLENADSADALSYACNLGAFIATQRGACPQYEPDKAGCLMNVN